MGEVGSRIRQIRIERNMSQTDLAEACGFSVPYVSDIERGKYHLAMGLVTSSWWLLTLGSYYLVLSAVRFVVLRTKSKERFIAKFTGWMLILLSIPLAGTVIQIGRAHV